MSNPLQALKIDYWYKAVLVICTALLIICLTVPLQGVSNPIASLICIGGIFIGLGEWINHPLQTSVGNGFQITGHPRRFNFLGSVFVLIGLGLVGYGVYSIVP
ncbi:hypothetical protein [Reinekea marinisedimentorum]|uniref:hypothetical protein n=1 Tax=Reinekea marinisedimentorum TaxID=230495 RepID=UPI001052716B|nr:hypothetical protein [Reinekea marinisedimentorum]